MMKMTTTMMTMMMTTLSFRMSAFQSITESLALPPVFFFKDIFVSLARVDGMYFVCNIDDFKFLADMIQHIPLNLRSRYVFCTAPINKKQPFVCTSFLKVRGDASNIFFEFVAFFFSFVALRLFELLCCHCQGFYFYFL